MIERRENKEVPTLPGKALKNQKHERFCYEYVKSLKVRESVILAGYKEDSAGSRGSELLRNSNIKARIDELLAWKSQQAAISIEDVVLGLKEVAMRCMKKKPVVKWDYELGQYVQQTDEDGNNVWDFDSQGANKALELLGKHVGAFEKDNLQKAPIINVVVYDEEEEIEFTTPIEIKDVDPDGTPGERKSNIQDSEKGVPTLLPPSSTK